MYVQIVFLLYNEAKTIFNFCFLICKQWLIIRYTVEQEIFNETLSWETNLRDKRCYYLMEQIRLFRNRILFKNQFVRDKNLSTNEILLHNKNEWSILIALLLNFSIKSRIIFIFIRIYKLYICIIFANVTIFILNCFQIIPIRITLRFILLRHYSVFSLFFFFLHYLHLWSQYFFQSFSISLFVSIVYYLKIKRI